MPPEILGISGSPIKNSNTDRTVQAILETSGLESEFVKLSDLQIGPCRACKSCVNDNVCKTKDDFPALAEKVKQAKALVIGSYTPYSMIDGFSKAFLERLWSMRHVHNLNRGKLVVTVVTGVSWYAVNQATDMIAQEMAMERMEVVGNLKVNGNVPCLTCGHGSVCKMSGVPQIFGNGTIASADKCVAVEDQAEVWDEAQRLGQILGERVRNRERLQNGRRGTKELMRSSLPPWHIPRMILLMLRTRRWNKSARRK